MYKDIVTFQIYFTDHIYSLKRRVNIEMVILGIEQCAYFYLQKNENLLYNCKEEILYYWEYIFFYKTSLLRLLKNNL